MARERYTFKLKSGHIVKIKKADLYGFDGPYGFYLTFQEQAPGGSGKVHTHVWIDNKENPTIIPELYMYVSWDFCYYPKKATMFAMVHGWALSEDEEEFEGPDLLYELIVDRKLSRTLVDNVFDWLNDVLYEFIPRMGMIGLFGEDETE